MNSKTQIKLKITFKGVTVGFQGSWLITVSRKLKSTLKLFHVDPKSYHDAEVFGHAIFLSCIQYTQRQYNSLDFTKNRRGVSYGHENGLDAILVILCL